MSWLSKFRILKPEIKDPPDLAVLKISSYEGYECHSDEHKTQNSGNISFENRLIPNPRANFKVEGYCYVCKTHTKFLVDFQYSYQLNNVSMPNWRERLICPSCNLINRHRATVHLFEKECRPRTDSKIYMTEQITPLYSLLKKRYPETCGSEYIGDKVSYGSCNANGIRNEDFTNLSFDNDEFDHILSFDVLEHILQYQKALLECLRCLKHGGMLFFSVPFNKNSEKNIVCARVHEDGNIEHILPPEYHGDPMSSAGVLCYNSFGWELLDEIRVIGFVDVHALFYWSKELGYLGGEQVQFKATKGCPTPSPD